ncbi:cytochrome c [Nitrospira sp.]|nr:cytochrome c [Nitrospira sp.]
MRMRNIIVGIAVSVALLSLIGARAIGAQTEADARAGDDVSGKIIFARHCAGCHGPQGVGDGYMMLGPDPANLTSPSTTHKSDAILLRTIHEGKPNMPSWKSLLSEEQSRAVLAYIRTLRK